MPFWRKKEEESWDDSNQDLWQAPGTELPGQYTVEYEQWRNYSGDDSELESVDDSTTSSKGKKK